jgi:hypothetical protein
MHLLSLSSFKPWWERFLVELKAGPNDRMHSDFAKEWPTLYIHHWFPLSFSLYIQYILIGGIPRDGHKPRSKDALLNQWKRGSESIAFEPASCTLSSSIRQLLSNLRLHGFQPMPWNKLYTWNASCDHLLIFRSWDLRNRFEHSDTSLLHSLLIAPSLLSSSLLKIANQDVDLHPVPNHGLATQQSSTF